MNGSTIHIQDVFAAVLASDTSLNTNKNNSGFSSLIELIPINSHYMARKKGTLGLSKDKQEKLKDLFLEGGMTPFQASKIVKCDHKTAGEYFKKFAIEITHEENHEDWFSREKRVRQRALEGYSTKIQEIREQIRSLRTFLDDAIKRKDDEKIERYERIIRQNTILMIDLLDRFDALEMTPPTEVLLEQEIEKRMLNAFEERR